MDRPALRSLTSQLAEDLAWLENNAREQKGPGPESAQLHLAAGLVRNVLGPWLENRVTAPLHIVIVGGAGAGKSTLANMLSGGPVAESNPQAGFTRHPVAYVSGSGGPVQWADYLGFLGPLKRLSRSSPSNLDEDVYQVRRVGSDSKDPSLLEKAVIWDCPDMTTAASAGYLPRLLEVASLADLILYVASDERYNDEAPTQFLRLLLHLGKPVIACLVKVRAEDAAAFVEHFEKEVVAQLPAKPIAIVTIPQLRFEQLQDPIEQAGPQRDKLLAEVKGALGTPEEARQRTVRAAVSFLKSHQNDLQGVAREDVAALEAWRNLCVEGQVELEQRYRREFLTTERFLRFDDAMLRLRDLLELPGVARYVSVILYVLRTPYRLARTIFDRAMVRPLPPALAEKAVLDEALTAWLDQLRKEATRQAGNHALWAHVQSGFASGLADAAHAKFEQGWRGFQVGVRNEIEPAARRIHEELEQRPTLLAALRVGKIALEIAAGLACLYFIGFSLLGFLMIPVAVSLVELLVELLVRAYVETRREQARARQQALLTQHLSGPLAAWLSDWPTTGGSAFERLHLALRRIGPALAKLDEAIQSGQGESRSEK